MNRIWICCLIFTLSLGSAAWSQERKAGGGTEVAGLEQQIRRAVIKGETSILERYLADDYVGIGPNGDAAEGEYLGSCELVVRSPSIHSSFCSGPHFLVVPLSTTIVILGKRIASGSLQE